MTLKFRQKCRKRKRVCNCFIDEDEVADLTFQKADQFFRGALFELSVQLHSAVLSKTNTHQIFITTTTTTISIYLFST